MKDGSAPKDVVNWTQTTVEEEFAAGKTAMMVNGPWNLPALNSIKGLNYGAVEHPDPGSRANGHSTDRGRSLDDPEDEPGR